ncbi:MAG: prolyl-tRNA synthetase, partial [Candidatus Colwellbacteria bacterium RBG_13_48_8]
MRQSELYTKTVKNLPKDETAKNARWLIRAGYIYKDMAGAYAYLPLGLRVLKKIEQIIREEMNAIGGQELMMTALQNPEVWQATKRWDDKVVDIWFKTRGDSLGLAHTHEEPITKMMTHYIHSYKDLPTYVYQFQTKFRNELRAKSGLLRVREFLMKDLYSFDADAAGLERFYQLCIQAYQRIFKRVGLGSCTYLTFAGGGSFSKYSHEFQTISDAGENIVLLDPQKKVAINKEVYGSAVLKELKLKKNNLVEKKAIEVANIFKLGTKFSIPLGLSYKDKRGQSKPVVMGSYGIGLGRLMATVVEVLADSRGLVWPESIAPFKV